MRKRVLTLLATALFGTTALHAQVQQPTNDTITPTDTLQTAQNDSLRAAIDDTVYRLKDYKFAAGLKLGFNGGFVRLTDESYEMYKRGLAPGAIIRGYFQWRTAFGLSLVPEVGYVGRGGLLTWEDVSYKQLVHCLDVRLAIRYNFDIKDKGLSPYVVVAPVWNVALGGKADYSDDLSGDINFKMTDKNMRTHDFGLFAGAGIEFPVTIKETKLNISAEAGYCWGFMNSFTEAEQNATGNVLNQYYDSHHSAGKRLARGLEISISIGMPFGKREKQNTIKEETKCEEEQK